MEDESKVESIVDARCTGKLGAAADKRMGFPSHAISNIVLRNDLRNLDSGVGDCGAWQGPISGRGELRILIRRGVTR